MLALVKPGTHRPLQQACSWSDFRALPSETQPSHLNQFWQISNYCPILFSLRFRKFFPRDQTGVKFASIVTYRRVVPSHSFAIVHPAFVFLLRQTVNLVSTQE